MTNSKIKKISGVYCNLVPKFLCTNYF